MNPILTKRLTIGLWKSSDIEDAWLLWGDSAVTALIDARGGLSRQQVETKLKGELTRQDQFGVQYWRVVDTKTKIFIGCCGLRPFDLENCVYEFGVHILSAHWGKGYAEEASRGVIQYAFETLRLPKLFAGHHPNNLSSKQLLRKLGFKYIGDRFYQPTGLDHPSYELSK
jgi:[ribosomal protein S5]-alanine N-acetyltransferase